MAHQVRTLATLLGLCTCLIGPKNDHSSFTWNDPKFRELNYSRTLSKAEDLDVKTKSALIRAITARLKPNMDSLEIADGKELRKVSGESRFELVDLNGDGTPEIIVQPTGLKSGCGATGNCPLWIFAKGPNTYSLLAEIEGIQMYRQERSGNEGYSDIAVATHDSASEKHIYVYRYSRGRYKPVACYDAWWVEVKAGAWKSLSRPSITTCPAGERR